MSLDLASPKESVSKHRDVLIVASLRRTVSDWRSFALQKAIHVRSDSLSSLAVTRPSPKLYVSGRCLTSKRQTRYSSLYVHFPESTHNNLTFFTTSMASSSSNVVGVHYRVGKKIGEGSFGVIFEGTNLLNNQQVAIKFVCHQIGPPGYIDVGEHGLSLCRNRGRATRHNCAMNTEHTRFSSVAVRVSHLADNEIVLIDHSWHT